MVRFNCFREKDHIFQGTFFFDSTRISVNLRTICRQLDTRLPAATFPRKNACLCLCRRTVLHGNSVSPCCLPLVYYYIILGMFLVCTFPFSFVCCILLYVCMFIILRSLIDKCWLSHDFECNLELTSTS